LPMRVTVARIEQEPGRRILDRFGIIDVHAL
jgi:hypothetical protein